MAAEGSFSSAPSRPKARAFLFWPFFAVGRGAFEETVRQPVYGLVFVGTLLSSAMSPALAMFSFEDDLNLLKDFGVSTLFLSGLILAVLGASVTVGRELESRTALLLLSKPVGRGVFLAAKLAGVVAAAALGLFVFSLALLLAARQGPPQDVHHPTDWPVAAGGIAAFFLALIIALALSFRSIQPLGALLVYASFLTFPGGFVLAGFFDRSWRPQPFGQGFDFLLVKASLLALLAVTQLSSAAVFLSAVFRRGALLGAVLVFLGGLLAGGRGFFGLSPLPDLQLFWVGELFYKAHPVLSWKYLGEAALLSLSYSSACLVLGAWVLNREEVG